MSPVPRSDQPLVALDAATGKTVRTYEQTGNALEIIAHDGTLFVVAGDRAPDNTGGAARQDAPEKIWHWWPITVGCICPSSNTIC